MLIVFYGLSNDVIFKGTSPASSPGKVRGGVFTYFLLIRARLCWIE
nr:MAG TPA: hypothetical protein [Caudoviricetes sp.]